MYPGLSKTLAAFPCVDGTTPEGRRAQPLGGLFSVRREPNAVGPECSGVGMLQDGQRRLAGSMLVLATGCGDVVGATDDAGGTGSSTGASETTASVDTGVWDDDTAEAPTSIGPLEEATTGEAETGDDGTDDGTETGDASDASSTGEPLPDPQCDDATELGEIWSAPSGGDYVASGFLWPSGYEGLTDDDGSFIFELWVDGEQAIRKLNADGTEAWTWSLGVEGLLIEGYVYQRTAMAWLSDGDLVVAGSLWEDASPTDIDRRWVARLDLDAQEIVWSHAMEGGPGATSTTVGVAVDGNGDIVLATRFAGDTIVSKLDPDGGDVVWEHTFDGLLAHDLLVHEDGSVSVVHVWSVAVSRVDADGNPLGTEALGSGLPRAVRIDSQGGYVFSVMNGSSSSYTADIRRYHADFSLDFQLDLDGVEGSTNRHAMALDPDDAILYAHHYGEGVTLYKIADGEIVAEQAIEQAGWAYGLTATDGCGFILGGRGPNDAGTGNVSWLRQYAPL